MTRPLTDQQKRAIEDQSSALQIVACAGAGKTEVLARRVAQALGNGIDPTTLIAFTFTNKAAGELKDRVERRSRDLGVWDDVVPPTAHGLFVGTIHSFCLEKVRGLGGRYEAYDILPAEREWALMLRYARRLGIVDVFAEHCEKAGDRVAASRAVEAFADTLELVHNERLDRRRLAKAAPAVADLVVLYEDLLDRMRLLSFGTAVETACRLLDPGALLARQLADKVSHVFVDEYQDLNRAQEALVRRLVALGANLTVVGDDDQAIYQWRGGDVELFVDFVDRFSARRRLLDVNHRSRARIARTAAIIADGIGERVPKEMKPGREDDEPALELMVARDADHEAELVAQRIAGLVAAGHPPGDVAILLRSVGTSGTVFRNTLAKHGIPCRTGGRLSLLSRRETALVTRVLVAWAGGVWWPDGAAEQVTDVRLTEDLANLHGVSVREARRRIRDALMLGEEAARTGCFDLVGRVHELLRVLGLPGTGQGADEAEVGLGQLSSLLAEFEHAQRRSGPTADELGSARTVDAKGEDAEDRTLEAAELASAPAPARLTPGVAAGEIFLRRLKSFLEAFCGRAIEDQPQPGMGDKDAVRLMTIHSAKGLEFPVVFVPALVARRFPSSLTGRPKDWLLPSELVDGVRGRYEGRLDDELRLLYVALTRARDVLIVSTFGDRPSSFVGRLEPAIALELVGAPGTARPPETDVGVADEGDLLDTDFSALAVYDECGFKYRLRYLCGFAPPIARELGFGHVLHHVLAELSRAARDGRPVNEALADEILDRDFYLPFAGEIERDKLLESARSRLHAFVARSGELLTRAIEPEYAFEVSLSGARLRGRIDLLASAEGGGERQVTLVDFKTTADRPPREVHENQLRLYAEAAHALGYEPVSLEIHDLRVDGSGASIVPDDPNERAAFRSKLDTWVAGIRAGTFEPCEGRSACRACDFRRFCRHAPGRA